MGFPVEKTVTQAKIKDLTPDTHNANKGTQRRLRLLDESLRQNGAGRSIVLDKNNRVIAGNKTVERAANIGLNDVLIVETDGTQLVAVKRTDLDLEDSTGQARKLAYADNRVGEIDLDWNPEQIAEDLAVGTDLSTFWSDEELAEITGNTAKPNSESELTISPELFERHDYLVFYFDNEFDWQVAIEALKVPEVLSGKVGKSTFKHKGLGRVLPAAELLKLLQND